MRCRRPLIRIILLILIIMTMTALSGCEQPAAPVPAKDVLTYKLSVDKSPLTVDIVYKQGTAMKSQQNVALPWSVDLDYDQSFGGFASLKATAAESSVFIPYASGTSAAVPENNKLLDPSVDFSAKGVVAGDRVYRDGHSTPALVETVSAHELGLNTNLFDAGSKGYKIYRYRKISLEILRNGKPAASGSQSSEKMFDIIVKTSLDG